MTNINITTILQVTPSDLAHWVSTDALNDSVPTVGLNATLDLAQCINLLPTIGNKMSLCTELYAACVGDKAGWTIAKKNPDQKALAETNVSALAAKIDILYRCIQTLESKKDIISRMMTGLNGLNKMGTPNGF